MRETMVRSENYAKEFSPKFQFCTPANQGKVLALFNVR